MNDYKPMLGHEFQLVLKRLGLDRETAAAVLGVTVRSIERYELAGTPKGSRIPRAAVVLLRGVDKQRKKGGFDILSELM